MDKVISVSIGEIALKGLNRKYFEDKLIGSMIKAIRDIGYERIYKEEGKIYIEGNPDNYTRIVNRIKKVFGIVYISPSYRCEKNDLKIKEAMIRLVEETIAKNREFKSFKVVSNRSDKSYHKKSPEISRDLGGGILSEFPSLKVDVHKPDKFFHVDIRHNYAYLYVDKIRAYGGLPIGTNGKGLLLLSGGIDSPVAGFMIGKRGVAINCIHYHSYPFTSKRAEEKSKELAKILARYCGKIKLYSINILEIQKEINEKCPEKEMTILSRRFMVRIAEKIARKNRYHALITGENLGQVASQTIHGISVINEAVSLPILRPLIGMDKVDIIKISKDIESYETSILPYEDACTVFLPKHPVTRPLLEDILKSEKALDINGLVNSAIANMEVYNIE